MSAQNVGGVSIRSRNGAPSRKGYVVNGQMTKQTTNPPPFLSSSLSYAASRSPCCFAWPMLQSSNIFDNFSLCSPKTTLGTRNEKKHPSAAAHELN